MKSKKICFYVSHAHLKIVNDLYAELAFPIQNNSNNPYLMQRTALFGYKSHVIFCVFFFSSVDVHCLVKYPI